MRVKYRIFEIQWCVSIAAQLLCVTPKEVTGYEDHIYNSKISPAQYVLVLYLGTTCSWGNTRSLGCERFIAKRDD